MSTTTIDSPKRDRDVLGCAVYHRLGDFYSPSGSIRSSVVTCHFQDACGTQTFLSNWSAFQNLRFTATTCAPTRRNYFQQALDTLPSDAVLGVVFHGTRPGNVPQITKEGLDASKRNGQAYGPGEYFGKDPNISISYCRGGTEILVMLVVLPSTIPTTRHHPRSQNLPPSYVVVEENAHHIPIGVLRFDSVDKGAARKSMAQRTQLQKLHDQVLQASKDFEEAQTKAAIIQALITNGIFVASEQYQTKRRLLNDGSKKEISWFVHQQVDPDIIPVLFEDLPEPNTDISAIVHVDVAEARKAQAKKRLRLELAKTRSSLPMTSVKPVA